MSAEPRRRTDIGACKFLKILERLIYNDRHTNTQDFNCFLSNCIFYFNLHNFDTFAMRFDNCLDFFLLQKKDKKDVSLLLNIVAITIGS